MAFVPSSLILWSRAPIPPQLGLPQWWGYSTTDTRAVVADDGYFNLGSAIFPINQRFLVGDQLYCYCSDGVASLQINQLTPNITTTASSVAIPPGSITHAMLGAGIVENINIASGTITTTQISSSAGILGSQLSNGTIGNNQISSQIVQYLVITSIDPKTLYSAGAVLTLAPPSGYIVLPIAIVLNYIYSTAQYMDGGAIGVQYGNNIHQGGQLCTDTLAAATFNAYSANTMVDLPISISGVSSDSLAQPLYLTCDTADFTAGSGIITLYMTYHVVPAN